MSENDNSGTSGNRWEPNDQDADGASQAAAEAPEASADTAATLPPHAAAEPVPAGTAPAAASARPAWMNNNKILAGLGAAVVLLVGGFSGFAIGRTTADDHGNGRDASFGPAFRDGGFDRDGDGNGGYGGPGNGFNGQQPPGMNGQGQSGSQPQSGSQS